jgi:ATP phosphoribosyltransferase
MDLEDAPRALVAHAASFPLEVLFVRTDDVVEFVGDGVADLGITGSDLLAETVAELPVRLELGFGRCRLEAAVPSDATPRTLDDLAGMRVATSHPQATRRLAAARGLHLTVVPISGAVEVAPRMGIADGIVDLVSTGSTLAMNGLRSVGVLLEAQAVLVGRPAPDPTRDRMAEDLITLLGAVIAGRRRKYLMMNAPADAVGPIERLLPGLASPSVIPLAQAGMVAMHAVVAADELPALLPRLRATGASGILVLPVERLIP